MFIYLNLISIMAFLAIIQHHNSGTGGDILTICHIWSDGLELLILGVHLEDAVSVQTLSSWPVPNRIITLAL